MFQFGAVFALDLWCYVGALAEEEQEAGRSEMPRSAIFTPCRLAIWNTAPNREGIGMKRTLGSFHLTSCCFLLLLLVVFSQPAAASDLRPVLDLTGGGFATVPLADAVGGWQFHLDSPLMIGAIGLWDEGGLSLQIAHDVGLWKSDGMFLISAIVDNSSTPVTSASPDGRWLFTPIEPMTFEPGD